MKDKKILRIIHTVYTEVPINMELWDNKTIQSKIVDKEVSDFCDRMFRIVDYNLLDAEWEIVEKEDFR